MKLEDQVCSLDLAKKLKGLGVKQESLFSWHLWRSNSTPRDSWEQKVLPWDEQYFEEGCKVGYKDCAAFTVAELGVLCNDAPFSFECDEFPVPITFDTGRTIWAFYINKKRSLDTQAATEADARAKMLIYLIETGHLKAEGE